MARLKCAPPCGDYGQRWYLPRRARTYGQMGGQEQRHSRMLYGLAFVPGTSLGRTTFLPSSFAPASRTIFPILSMSSCGATMFNTGAAFTGGPGPCTGWTASTGGAGATAGGAGGPLEVQAQPLEVPAQPLVVRQAR